MEDGRHTDGAEETSQSTSKVVRLPRDWLGPHEELVPFGKRAMRLDVEHGVPEPSGSPPSAEDFWGERSAAIHDVVQAPGDGEVAESASGIRSRPAFGPAHRRLAAASILAVAAATVIAVLTAGPGRHVAGDARLNMAAIFTSGVSRILDIGPPPIISATGAARPHHRPVRPVLRHAAVGRQSAQATRHHPSLPPPATTHAARATPSTTPPPYHSSHGRSSTHAGSGPSQASASASSGASVSATGESGALGPVQSPNG